MTVVCRLRLFVYKYILVQCLVFFFPRGEERVYNVGHIDSGMDILFLSGAVAVEVTV